MINLRKFTNKDIPYILENWVGTDKLDGAFKNDDQEKLEKRFSFWENETNAKGAKSFGFCIELDKPIGAIWYTENTPNELTLSIYIDASFRGKGYGSQACKIAEESLKQKGFYVIKSSCRQDNFKSIKLHEKLGFELLKKELSPNGTPMIRWKKKLSN